MTGDTQSRTRTRIQAIAARELVTVFRARSTYVLFVGFLLVTFGVVLASGSEPDYLPTAVDLLLPMELLVPGVAIALGYRTIASDARSGELAVLETYSLPSWGYVVGVYIGRAVALASVVGVPLLLVGIYVATVTPETPTFFATHSGVDSPIVFVRFIALTLWFGCTVLAMALAASAVAGARRSALVAAIVLLLVVVIALDLLVVRGFTGGTFGGEQLTTVLAFSPASGYRGLVFETVLSTATEGSRQHAATGLSAIGLFVWLGLSLFFATMAVFRR